MALKCNIWLDRNLWLVRKAPFPLDRPVAVTVRPTSSVRNSERRRKSSQKRGKACFPTAPSLLSSGAPRDGHQQCTATDAILRTWSFGLRVVAKDTSMRNNKGTRKRKAKKRRKLLIPINQRQILWQPIRKWGGRRQTASSRWGVSHVLLRDHELEG